MNKALLLPIKLVLHTINFVVIAAVVCIVDPDTVSVVKVLVDNL
jgi:hypothetical protein